MGLDEYTFGSLISRIRSEFGETDNPDTNEVIGNKINGALLWICKRRKWPFMRKELAVDVGDSTTVMATINRGSNVLSLVAPAVTPQVRDWFTPGNTTDSGGDGYMISAVGPTDTFYLASQYRGVSLVASSAGIQKGTFELPADFARMEGRLKQSDPLGIGDMTYVSPVSFRDYMRSFRAFALRERIYTVQSDPLGLTNKYYLCVYPFISTLLTLHGGYWRVPQQMTSNSDIPIIPPEHRDVIFYFACWFYAQSKGTVETVTLYQQQAMETLKLMSDSVDMVDEEENMSVSSSDPSSYIMPPSNYEDFN